MDYLQNYDPLNNAALSTLMAATPVVVLLYLLALHPRKQKDGGIHMGIEAHYAAAIAVVVAFFVACYGFKMPAATAGMSLLYGGIYGFFPIGAIVVAAMFLYTITLVSGTFDVVKQSVASISDDKRIQAILIAFSFGAFIEGAAGFGTPVAISGALMVGLGFKPLQAAILCLIANTAPVAFGAVGTPINGLTSVTGIPQEILGKMAARQLPIFSLIVPVWMTAVQVRMDGKSWRHVWEVWPALLVAGGSFAVAQFIMGNYISYMLVDIVGGVFSMVSVAVFMHLWTPPRHYDDDAQIDRESALAPSPGTPGEGGGESFVAPAEANRSSGNGPHPDPLPAHRARETDEATRVLGYSTTAAALTPARVAWAWLPWILLSLFVFLWGLPKVRTFIDQTVPGAVMKWPVPKVHGMVYRSYPVVKEKAIDPAIYTFDWASRPPSGIFIAAIISGLLARLSFAQWKLVIGRTAQRLKTPLLCISLILGMGFITKYSGMDAVLGLAFTKTGANAYPFFAAMLGWLGVALTGSDTSSNVMFGSMQKITAEQLGLNPVLITTANSTGGVMGKMIDAQSIVVATAACYEDRQEGKMAVGPIFRGVFVHSVILAMMMGAVVWLQAHVWPWMVPAWP